MPWFIKTEKFNIQAQYLSEYDRKKFIKKHIEWVEKLSNQGIILHSGYLVNEHKMPGGGGVLLIKEVSYIAAIKIIKNDPIILANLVDWSLQEWVLVSGNLIK